MTQLDAWAAIMDSAVMQLRGGQATIAAAAIGTIFVAGDILVVVAQFNAWAARLKSAVVRYQHEQAHVEHGCRHSVSRRDFRHDVHVQFRTCKIAVARARAGAEAVANSSSRSLQAPVVHFSSTFSGRSSGPLLRQVPFEFLGLSELVDFARPKLREGGGTVWI